MGVVRSCVRYKTVRKRVCAEWAGGGPGRGAPGKRCVRFKTVTARVCADYA